MTFMCGALMLLPNLTGTFKAEKCGGDNTAISFFSFFLIGFSLTGNQNSNYCQLHMPSETVSGSFIQQYLKALKSFMINELL